MSRHFAALRLSNDWKSSNKVVVVVVVVVILVLVATMMTVCKVVGAVCPK